MLVSRGTTTIHIMSREKMKPYSTIVLCVCTYFPRRIRRLLFRNVIRTGAAVLVWSGYYLYLRSARGGLMKRIVVTAPDAWCTKESHHQAARESDATNSFVSRDRL